jgi:hypothetical protein
VRWKYEKTIAFLLVMASLFTVTSCEKTSTEESSKTENTVSSRAGFVSMEMVMPRKRKRFS